MTTTEIERRLTVLEQEIATLKADRAAPVLKKHPAEVLEATHGTFQKDEAFQEATRLGRKWRNSVDAKPHHKSKAKRK